MNGSTYKRERDGTWCFQIYLGKDEQGKPIRLTKAGFATKREADEEKAHKLAEARENQVVKPSPQTLNAFMAEWFKEHAQRHCAPKTVERYREQAAYFLPSLGHVKLADLNGLTIEREMNRLKDAGGHHRKTKAKRPLSAKSVRNIAGVLNGALGTAVRWKLIKSNPMAAVQLPKLERSEAVALDADKTEWFLAAARGHYLHPVLCLAAATGCRRGELLALTWPDVSTVARSIIVSKSLEQTKAGLRIKCPKSGRARTFPLPAVALEALETHRQQQAEHRRLYAADYRTDLNLVFATPEGDYLKPDTVTAAACLLAKRAGLDGVGLHSLRHSHGSQLLSAGVPLPTVSKRLGHASTHITAQIYAHAFTKDEQAAADIWDTTMRKAVEGDKARQ